MSTNFELKKLSPQSRFSINDTASLPPGVCFICNVGGGVDDRKFLDFGKQMKWYGAVYFCSECIKEIAQALDFYPAEVMKMLLESNGELVEANIKIKKEMESIRDSHRAIARTLSNCTCSSDGSHSHDDENVSSDSKSESDDQPSFEFDSIEGFDSIHGAGDDD